MISKILLFSITLKFIWSKFWIFKKVPSFKIFSLYLTEPSNKNNEPLVFKGIGIEIESIEIDERSLLSADYRLENNNLIIDTQEFNSFKLKIISTINGMK